MNFQKKIKDLLKNKQLIIGLAVALILFLIIKYYNKQLGNNLASMSSQLSENNEFTQEDSNIEPSGSDGMNSVPGNATGIDAITNGINSNTAKQQISDPSELLPKSSNGNWEEVNTRGTGELSNISLLKAGHHAGIDTVGGTLRNANLQIRSEPANPKSQVSPWSNSTIEPDLMRVPLELGSSAK